MEFLANDGSELKFILASRLSGGKIWAGNRNIDEDHVLKILAGLKSPKDLNNGLYKMVTTTEDGVQQFYIIDGQHRISILKRYFTNPDVEDFECMVLVKHCESEAEIIDYFKMINTTKSIQWEKDPNLIANEYIKVLTETFNKDPKKPFLRSIPTRQPYLSVDKLRKFIIQKDVVSWKKNPEEWATECVERNKTILAGMGKCSATDIGFALGVTDSWVYE